MAIAFNQIPSDLRVPGVYAEIDPSQANNNEQTRKSVIAGQILNTGSVVLTVATSAETTATGSADTLTFTNAAAIANLNPQPGRIIYAIDRTTPAAISQGTTVVSKSNGVVTLSEPIANNVLSGDSIEFSDCTPQLVNSQAQLNLLYGRGSQIAEMYGYYRARDNFGEVWAVPFPDDPSGVKASGSIVVSGSVSQNSVLYVYANGVRCPVTLTAAMNATQIHAAIAAAINAAINPATGSILPMSASSSSSAATVTARNAGAFGNDFDLRLNYLGPAGGEVTPAGLTVTITGFAGGAVNASTGLLNGLNNLPVDFWGYIAQPYSDTTSLNNCQTFMSDYTGQFAWSNMHYGNVFGAINGTLGSLQSAGTARNDQHMSLMGVQMSPSPPYAWAAVYAADAAAAINANPAASLDGTALLGLVPPSKSDIFEVGDQQTLLWSGISTFDVNAAGQVTVNKAISTYQLNTSGDPDDSYLDVEILYKVTYCLLDLKTDLQSKYAGANLIDDNQRAAPGQKVISPSIAKAEMVARYGYQMGLGLVEDIDDFEANLILEINATNSDRLDALWPGVMVKNFDILAILAQFRNGVTGD